MTTTNIIDSWPFPYEPRQVQIQSLEWLANQTAKFLILEAPVGSGKSNIGITYSRYLGNSSFILTPQKILQAQYESSFRDNKQITMASFYGKSNYTCKHKKANCEIGEIIKPACTHCPFQAAKAAARTSPNTVMNYKLALLAYSYTNTFSKKRALMIMDECHTLENHLVDFDAVAITETRCKKHNVNWLVPKSVPDALSFINDKYLPRLSSDLTKLEEEIEPLLDKSGIDLSSTEVRKIRDCKALQEHHDEVVLLTHMDRKDLTENFVLTYDKIQFAFKRITGAYSFNRIILPQASRFLFMSSTILNKDGFCRDLGIDPSQAAFLSVESEFPPENRPVVYMPQMKMNSEWKKPDNKKNRELMVNAVKTLLKEHKDETGIIHTGNYEIAKWLVEELEYTIPHRLYHHNPNSGNDRGSVITAFMGDPKPSVLISPSITEGLDLKEDLGRFAITIKVPYGNLGDQWIKRRMELSLEWYQRRALIDIIQGGGRVVRSPTDKGNVYILDQSFGYLYTQTRHMVPEWWKKAYHTL